MQQHRPTSHHPSNFKFISKGIITEPGKLITFPFDVTVTVYQSISIISHIVFLCKVIFSLFILPINLNK